MWRDSDRKPYSSTNPLIMSGAGLCKSGDPQQVKALLDAGADKVVVGSITLEPREGNLGRTEYFDNPDYGINCIGMSNPGIHAFLKHGAQGENVIVSVAGFTVDEFTQLFVLAQQQASTIELNLSCPNVKDGGVSHEIICMNPKMVEEILGRIANVKINRGLIVGVKLSPFDDIALLNEVANVINRSRVVDYVATCNTIPDQQEYRPDGSSAIQASKDGKVITTGGMSGGALREARVRNTNALRKRLYRHIDVIAVGGISDGQDVADCYDAKMTGVQIVTATYQSTKGVGVIGAIKQDYAEILHSRKFEKA